MSSDVIVQAGHRQLFDIGRDSRYHRARVRFFAQVERAAMVLLLVFVALSGGYFLWAGFEMWSLAVFTAVSVGAFVFAHLLGRGSQRHRRQLDALEPLEQWASGRPMTAETVSHLTTSYARIVAEAPPMLEVLKARCHNEQRQAMGGLQTAAFTLSPWQRRLAPFFDLNSKVLKEQARRRDPNGDLGEAHAGLSTLTCYGETETPPSPAPRDTSGSPS